MLVLVGPSASGKTEAVKLLISEYGMQKLVTYTSRPMRIHEVDGKDYHFISKEEFEKKIKENFFLEYVEYNHNYYGTAYEDLADNKVVILEPSGVKTYLKKVPEKIKVCYLRTPIEYRKRRMIERGDLEDQIKLRIDNDDLIFNHELESIVNWVIDSNDITIQDMTKEIYELYEPYLWK